MYDVLIFIISRTRESMLLFKVFPPFRWLCDHTLLTKTYIYCIDKASKHEVHERRYSLRLAVSAMYLLPLT